MKGFISFHIATKEQYFTIYEVNYFTFTVGEYFTKYTSFLICTDTNERGCACGANDVLYNDVTACAVNDVMLRINDVFYDGNDEKGNHVSKGDIEDEELRVEFEKRIV